MTEEADLAVAGRRAADLDTLLNAARQSPVNLIATISTLLMVLSNFGYTLVKVPAADETGKISERVAIIESKMTDLQRAISDIKTLPAASDAKLSKIADSVRELNGAVEALSETKDVEHVPAKGP